MLALWEYFWTEADWTPATASAEDVVVAKFGSKGRDYHPLPDEFWETRERYLRRFVEPIVKQSKELPPTAIPDETTPRLITRATIEQAKLRAVQQARDTLLEKAQVATDRAELQQLSTRIIKLSLDILKSSDQYYIQAAIILLLDIF